MSELLPIVGMLLLFVLVFVGIGGIVFHTPVERLN
jgi:hypothetical protein